MHVCGDVRDHIWESVLFLGYQLGSQDWLDNQAWKPVLSHHTGIALRKLNLNDLPEDGSEVLKGLLLLDLWDFHVHLWLFMEMGGPTLGAHIFTTIIASLKVVPFILCIGLLYHFGLIIGQTLLDIRIAPYPRVCLAYIHLIDWFCYTLWYKIWFSV